MKRYTCAWWWPPLNFLRWPLPLPPPFFVRPGLRFIFAFLWIFLSPPCAIPGALRYRPSEGSSQLARSLRVGLCSLKSVALTGTRCARHRARSSRRCRADPKVRNAPSWSTTAAAAASPRATGSPAGDREDRFAICRFAATRSGGGGAAGARTSMRLHQAARVLAQRPKPRPIGPQRYGAPRPLVSRSGVATESLRRALAYLAILS